MSRPDSETDEPPNLETETSDDDTETDLPPFVEVPLDQLSPPTLDRLLADVALRDDTDYGDRPVELERRVALAREALARGELVVVFDTRTETASVVPRAGLPTRDRARSS